jgi:type VI secretion system protein VasI
LDTLKNLGARNDMKIYSLIAMLTISPPILALADLKVDIAKCAAIKPDGARIICFDKISSELKVDAPKTETVSGSGKWVGRIETSPIDDSKNAFLTLIAETPVRKRYETTTPMLSLRCKERKLEAYITFNFFLGSESTRVLTRLDKKPSRNASWSISTDHKGVFAPGNIAVFVKELIKADTLLVELTPYSESPVMTTFDVRGLADASKQLQQTCPWK